MEEELIKKIGIEIKNITQPEITPKAL